MKDQLHLLSIKVQNTVQSILARQEGQDLIEYALVVALVALGATAGMKVLATAINVAFTNIASSVGSCTTPGGC